MLLFNWCGYRWMISLLQQQADNRLEAKLDNNEYDESQLIEIKIPSNLPYRITQARFERCYGEAEINGIRYTYVKCKLEDGQFILKCISNEAHQRLQNIGDYFFKLINGLQPDDYAKKPNSPTPVKNALGDYDNEQRESPDNGQFILSNHYVLYKTPLAIDKYHFTPEQPPEA